MTALTALLPRDDAAAVLAFWFAELSPEDWYGGGDALDERVRARFLGLYERLVDSWADADAAGSVDESPAALASVIVLDQFPRNMFRGTAQAFATDFLALGLARRAVDIGLADRVEPHRRQFFFLPFMHAEDMAAQDRGVALVAAVPELAENLPYAIEHRETIRRFGRFPHRNRALGRRSTPDEEAFLAGHEGFGR